MRAWPKHPCDPTILLTPSLLLPCPIRTFCSAPSLLLLLLPPPLFSTIYVHRHRHRHRHRYHSFLLFFTERTDQTRPDHHLSSTKHFPRSECKLPIDGPWSIFGLPRFFGFSEMTGSHQLAHIFSLHLLLFLFLFLSFVFFFFSFFFNLSLLLCFVLFFFFFFFFFFKYLNI